VIHGGAGLARKVGAGATVIQATIEINSKADPNSPAPWSAANA
jgi:hypothetical protein